MNIFQHKLIFCFSLILLFTVSACKKTIPYQKEISFSAGQIHQYWDLKEVSLDGDTLILSKDRSALVSLFTAKDFSLHLSLMTLDGAEGSVDFHLSDAGDSTGKGYAVKINNHDYRSGSPEKTGSLSAIRNNYVRLVNDNEWFDLTIHVTANHIRVLVNNQMISDYVEPENPLRIPQLENRLLSEGLIKIRKSGNAGSIYISEIRFINHDPSLIVPSEDPFLNDSTGKILAILNQQGFPVIDFHGHLKGGLTAEQVEEHGRINGYNYGIAPNCGLHFPVTNDSSLLDWYSHMAKEPVFKAMQCEGREWVTLFSPEAIARYDYIFTDAMTWTDHKGRRLRLWIPEETFVDNEQQFMDMLTDKIVAELSQEPVDIYVNPTYLPEVIVEKYDVLWTEERMDKIIHVLVENDVALEINSRFQIPSLTFVKKAKKAGVKFTLGTNNAGSDDLGRLDYSLMIVKEAGLVPSDMFLPRPAGDKKVLKKGLPKKITG